MREVEIVVLDMYECYLAKGEIRAVFRNLDLARSKLIPREMVLSPFRESRFRNFLLEAPESELRRFFDEEEIRIIRAYRRIVEEDVLGAVEEKRFLNSIDFETFSNFVLKLAKLRVSWGCLRNFELGERIFEKELKKITEYFERWKRGEIDYERFRDRTARWRRKIDDKIEDLFRIIWRPEIEEEARERRRALGLEE